MITQPDNTTACEKGTVMFTCVIDTSNVNISTEDIIWWRKKRDHNNNLLPDSLEIPKHGNKRVKIINSDNRDNITSVLLITDVRSIDAGPYWLSLMDTESAVAFLSIVLNGKYNCINEYMDNVRMQVFVYI